MGREATVGQSILSAILRDDPDQNTWFGSFYHFFSVFDVVLSRCEPALFKGLRKVAWLIAEADYRESFRGDDEKGTVKSIGDMGYSGSSFFTTSDSKFLIKSLPRFSEYSFFQQDLLQPYAQHMRSNPSSLLVRITDFLIPRQTSTLGGWFRVMPTHHICMENILHGRSGDAAAEAWETYDLKPTSYFYPERDLAKGVMATDSIQAKLFDKFEDKVRVRETQRRALLDALAKDTELLAARNVTDYSLYLVRYPVRTTSQGSGSGDRRDVPAPVGGEEHAGEWRRGVESRDGKWVYRAVLLDFFWAKHKIHPQAMTGLIGTFNFFFRKGHMSITTSAPEYRERFLKLVEGLFESDSPEI